MNLILCNTIFDRENDNVLLFDSKEQLYNYFDNLGDKVEITDVNFNAGNIINTSVVVNIDNTLSLFKLLNYNYCVVVDGQNPRLFYFIRHSTQLSGCQIKLELEIDPFNTYAYDIMGPTTALEGLIEKAHVDRFVDSKTQPGNKDFNFKYTSPLFEREEIKDVPKKLVKQFEISPVIDTTGRQSAMNKWIANNVSCWLYIYLKGNVVYKYNRPSINPKPNPDVFEQTTLANLWYDNIGENDSISSNFVVIAAPIMKTNAKMKVQYFYQDKSQTFDMSAKALFSFLFKQGNGKVDYSSVQSIKFSIMPPLPLMEYRQGAYDTNNTEYDIINGNLVFYSNDSISSNGFKNKSNYLQCVVGNKPASIDPLLNVCFQVTKQDIKKSLPMEIYDTQDFEHFITKWTFTPEQIKSNYVEPKLLNEDFSTYRLICAGKQYDLPISKTSPIPTFKYKEILSPDITKGILIFDVKSSIFFPGNQMLLKGTENDFSGFTTTLDLSMWFPSNELNNYLANNKNFLQIMNNQQGAKFFKTILGAGVGSAIALGTGRPVAAGLAAIGGVVGTNSNLIDYATELTNKNFTLDNMKNSPDQTSNINSDALLIQSVSGIQILLEILEPIDFEKQIIVDQMKMFGYNIGKIDNVYKYIKTRKYYNFIKTKVIDINAPISEDVKDLIKERLSQGIRIWHADNFEKIDFSLNNYERSL